jgi:ribosomal protein S18 acetylase RimI-like enzyme
MEPRITIRRSEAADLDAMHALRRRAYAPVWASFRELVGDELWDLALANSEAEQAALMETLHAGEAGQEMYVAEAGGVIAGFVAVMLNAEQKLGEIGLNAVDPPFQGRGVGAQLYEFALQRMREAGMQAAFVSTGGDDSHAPARRAYEKAGFHHFVPSVWMVRRL